MKRIIALISISLSALILMSCAAGRYPYPTNDLAKETWRSQIQTDSNRWATKADQWFLAGGDSYSEIANESAPVSEAITHTEIRVNNFNNVNIKGDFKVEMFDEEDNNGVWIEGPNVAVRAVAVSVRNNTLCLEQVANAPSMSRVIVHIGIKQLKSLAYNGNGRVEAIRIKSSGLTIKAAGCGNIFLAGRVNVKSIINMGQGSINVFTLFSEGTSIESFSSGAVNIDAKQAIVLRRIVHNGTGDISVIGAVSPSLVIDATGKGRVSVSGQVTIKEIRASGQVCVFVSASSGGIPCIYVFDDARVGIDGGAGTLYAYTTRTSRLMARNLLAQTSYVEASGTSHVNANATGKIFATARDYATIYFFGNPAVVYPFEKNNGSVIAMAGIPQAEPVAQIIKDKHLRGGFSDDPAPRYGWRKGRLVELHN